MGEDLFLPSLGIHSQRIIMPAQLKVKDLVVGNRYNVFFVDSTIKRSMGATPDIVQSTGTFRKIVDGEAVIEKDEKDKKGNPIRGYFGDRYRFEEVPSANPERPKEFTEEQWEKACARAKRRYVPETWENPPYEGKTNPDGWRFSQCYTSALTLFPPPPEPPAGPGFRAVRALKKGAKGNPEGGRKTRTRKTKRRNRKTRRSV